MTFTRKPFPIAHLDPEVLEESAEDSAVTPTLNVVGKILCSTNYLSLIKKLPGGDQGKSEGETTLLMNSLSFQTTA